MAIKSKYMQSATKRKTPAVGKTPSAAGKTPAANNMSNRQKIDEVCFEFLTWFSDLQLSIIYHATALLFYISRFLPVTQLISVDIISAP